MRGHVRLVANRRRQSINKAHLTLHHQSSRERIGAIKPYFHHIKPSMGVGFKILVGSPLFFPLDGQTKGGVVVGTITCFFMIQNENPIISNHVQFFNFWSNFHCSCMILVVHSFCIVCEFKHLLNLESHEDRE